MNNANLILLFGYQWVNPPTLMTGDFRGFLPNGDINVWYPETTGWGRIERKHFLPGEPERLTPECKVERFCGHIQGPKGLRFTILARIAAWSGSILLPRGPMASKKPLNQTTYYVIWLRTGQCVSGFRYPPKLHSIDPKCSDTTKYVSPGDNELPIAEACYAILDNERPWKFDSLEGAKFIAQEIPGSKVEPWED